MSVRSGAGRIALCLGRDDWEPFVKAGQKLHRPAFRPKKIVIVATPDCVTLRDSAANYLV